MSTGLERRVARLEQDSHGSAQLIIVEVAVSPERDEEHRLVRAALAEREIVRSESDLLVVIRKFSAEPGHAYVLGVQPMAAR